MGKVKLHSPVKIITGLIFNNPETFEKTIPFLTKKFGHVDLKSESFLFNHTYYYNEEIGQHLLRKFLSFQKLKDLENIYKLKLFTNKLEKIFSIKNKRRINIDPGYLDHNKLVLLTTKNYSQRIYLKNGIYAEVTLFYKDKSYQGWEWTYPDYKTKDYIDFFNRVREIYIKDLKKSP